ncbi:MAG: enolase C-terminal domain-like protein [Candidatus Latescibacterota bacterium]
MRVSKGGGITPCRKIAALCEWFGVQTAWQEGGDNDPVNQAAAMHLDMATPSFGIQEENHFMDEELEVFPGHAELAGGPLYPNQAPGLGLDVDEEKAGNLLVHGRTGPFWAAEDCRADGSVVRP